MALLSYSDASDLILAQAFDWGQEQIPLSEAAGRILRESIRPDRPQPPFDRVTMDGIAIHYPSYAAGQRYFPVDRAQMAGDAPSPLVAKDYCREIMTGSPLPAGATTVIRYEDLREESGGFHLPDGIADRKNVHWRGSDWPGEGAAEQALMLPGRRIDVAATGMLATFGYATVTVSSLPRVAIISTGNELVDVAEQPLDHQIRRSNVYQLRHRLGALRIQPTLFHLPDDPAVMKPALAEILEAFDLILLSGGVSKGKKDYVPGLLSEAGINKLLHGVAQRPGKPLWVGRNTDTMVFGLPGNPVSTLVSLLVYVLPFIQQCLAENQSPTPHARLAADHTFSPTLTRFLPVSLHSQTDDGALAATPVTNQGSGDATSLLATDGFLILPATRASFTAGEVFPLIPLRGAIY